MPTNELVLTKTQAGLESTHGTGVAATRILNGELTPKIERSLNWGKTHTGTFVGRRRATQGRVKPTFSYAEEATFEDLPWWSQTFAKGGVTAVSDGGVPPAYPYNFAPDTTTDTLKSMTLEYNEPGNILKTTQVMTNSWTLRGDTDNDSETSWMFDAELLGRDVTTGSTYTAALTERVTEPILARGTKIYMDSTTMGSTQLTGKLISWSITGTVNVHMKAFSEDINSYAANKIGRQERTLDAQFTMEFDDHTELDNFLAASVVARFVRLEREGTQIHTGTTTNKRLRLDMVGYWASWSRADREGNLTAVLTLQAGYDTTLANDYTISVVNALSTLP